MVARPLPGPEDVSDVSRFLRGESVEEWRLIGACARFARTAFKATKQKLKDKWQRDLEARRLLNSKRG
jgi:hypothetical protein